MEIIKVLWHCQVRVMVGYDYLSLTEPAEARSCQKEDCILLYSMRTLGDLQMPRQGLIVWPDFSPQKIRQRINSLSELCDL